MLPRAGRAPSTRRPRREGEQMEGRRAGRRRILMGLLGAGLALSASAAYADAAAPAAPPAPTPVVAPRFVDCAVFMLHHTDGPEVADLIARNLGAGRRPVTIGQLGTYLLGSAAPPPE